MDQIKSSSIFLLTNDIFFFTLKKGLIYKLFYTCMKKTKAQSQSSTVIQAGVIFVVLAAIILVAYAVKFYTG